MTPIRDGEGLLRVLRGADQLVEAPERLPALRGLTTDSREVEAGSLFVAVRGSQQDGHRFAAAALDRGAAALVVERALDLSAPQIVVRDGRLAALALARAWYGEPARRLRLAGVTGTSGKTTTTLLIRHLLNGRGTAGSIGTLGAVDGDGRPVRSTAGALTTPGPVDLQATLAGLASRGVDLVALETSSHSLDQGRLDGLVFASAVFTNLTREHLDYHPTMEDYRAAKLRLLDLLAPDGGVAVNRDDPAWEAIGDGARVISFGAHPDAALRASAPTLGPTGSRFRVEGRFGTADVALPLPGEFNVANALAATACALGLGLELGDAVDRLADAPQVPGRMERIAERPAVVIRDYAHKPDALERVLRSLRPLTRGRLIALFGCGGDRDRGKRPIMGRIAAELSDLVVVTSDNPRTEDPERILDEITAGIPPGRPCRRLADRREAIRWALAEAGPGDTLLLAGKGHETYQIVGSEHRPFDERAIVLEQLGAAAG
jgi:UDP-N-acetylmuramoyl-L-alanyl-D-glutamate--2,6-diaminopimelate ligase